MIKSYVTETNTLLIVIDGKTWYEFRDITPRDIQWIDFQNEATQDLKDFIKSLNFTVEFTKRLIISCNHDIEKEDWITYVEISKILQENLVANLLTWQDFLSLCFAAGNKSFSNMHFMMDMNITNVIDIHDTIVEYYKMQEKMMDEAKGIKR